MWFQVTDRLELQENIDKDVFLLDDMNIYTNPEEPTEREDGAQVREVSLSSMFDDLMTKASLSGLLYGETDCEQNIIGLNEIFYLQYTEEYMNDTIPHEVAHLIHGQKNGCAIYNTNYIPAMHLSPFPEILEALGGDDDLLKNPDTELLCRFRLELLKARVMTEVCDSCTISEMSLDCSTMTVKVLDYKIKAPQ